MMKGGVKHSHHGYGRAEHFPRPSNPCKRSRIMERCHLAESLDLCYDCIIDQHGLGKPFPAMHHSMTHGLQIGK